MRIALLQLNPTVGAVAGNAAKLLDFTERARRAGATIAVASELSLTGYPPRDLLDRDAFLRAAAAETARLIERIPEGITLLFGAVGEEHDGAHRCLYNEAVVARRGAIVARARKRLLPTYDVFDEARYFEPGTEGVITTIDGLRVAVTICEDAWAESSLVHRRYRQNPLDDVDPGHADVLVNLSASPFTLPKLQERPRLFQRIAATRRVPVVLVNQVGGNDELLFDGRSAVWNGRGELTHRARMFEEELLIATFDGPGAIADEISSEEEAAYRALVLGVRDYAAKCGFRQAVVGLSGGVDSALTAAVAADALGPEQVLGVAMPTRYSSAGSRADAAALAKNLGIQYRLIDIDPIFESYIAHLGPALDAVHPPPPEDVTLENVQARIRGATLMALSNRTGALVLTTGNKSEIAVGYCTLYGDMVGGLAVISDVPKTMVYRIARWLNRGGERIPRGTIEKPPSAELRPDQTDQDTLPPYDVLDRILELYIEQQRSAEEIEAAGIDPATVAQVLRRVRASEYKRKQAAPGLIITSKAFGPGRRMPIAQGFVER